MEYVPRLSKSLSTFSFDLVTSFTHRAQALTAVCIAAVQFSRGTCSKALHSNVLWLFKTQSQVRNKSPDNCITVQPVSFVKYKLHPACQTLKSWAGRAQDWKWQKQIAAAAILGKENGRLNAFLYVYKEFILFSMNQ